jgi:CDGSH-type Zn-finger protein
MLDHQHSTQTLKGHIRTKVTLRKGEVISLCRCWQSKNFPLCDSSHKHTDDDKGPVVIFTDCDENFHEEIDS